VSGEISVVFPDLRGTRMNCREESGYPGKGVRPGVRSGGRYSAAQDRPIAGNLRAIRQKGL